MDVLVKVSLILLAFSIMVALLTLGLRLVYAVGKTLGEISALQKQATEASHIAVVLSGAAFANSQALKNAPVLRQLIERFVPIKKDEDGEAKLKEKMGALSKEFQAMYSVDAEGNGVPSITPEETV